MRLLYEILKSFSKKKFDRQNNKDQECLIILIIPKLIFYTKYRKINDFFLSQIKIK